MRRCRRLASGHASGWRSGARRPARRGTSAVPHALGQPNLLDTASPVLGALSVALSSLLSVAVLAALVLLAREARTNQLQPARGER